MGTLGVLVRVPLPFGSAIGALSALLVTMYQLLIFMTSIYLLKMFFPLLVAVLRFYTNLPLAVENHINNFHIHFNDNIEDALIWSQNKNGTYSTKSGFHWLLTFRVPATDIIPHPSWSWIWNLQVPEKYKFLIWLACQNVVPTLSLLHRRNIAPSPTCARCGEEDETFLHCVRDCHFSRSIWQKIGFTGNDFFTATSAHDWFKIGMSSSLPDIFFGGLWWAWRHRNLMCLNNETMSLFRLCNNIVSAATYIKSAFDSEENVNHSDRFVKWNNRNHHDHILNVDGSCLGTPSRTGYGGILRNSAGLFISGFSGFIPNSTDILQAELTAIHQSLHMVIDSNMNDVMCYSDSLLAVNLIMNDTPRYHTYAVLIQNIKDLLSVRNITLHHTLREGNQCADFFAKLGANSDVHLVVHQSPPADLLPLLRADAIGTVFIRS
ncbi:uncharacterized protein [Medicago truncatula]|nr:uncharacterized protein LOC112417459 [Medicago truncatula]